MHVSSLPVNFLIIFLLSRHLQLFASISLATIQLFAKKLTAILQLFAKRMVGNLQLFANVGSHRTRCWLGISSRVRLGMV